MYGGGGFHHVAGLTVEDRMVDNNQQISQVLMEEFFDDRTGTTSQQDVSPTESTQLPWEPLTMHEVREAVLRAQPQKAPGLDDIPAIVWKELWPILGRWIFLLFEASLRTGAIPQALEAGQNHPATQARQARLHDRQRIPTSFVVAHPRQGTGVGGGRTALLPGRDILAPPQKPIWSTQTPLDRASLLQEKIYDAWRDGKVLSLVSFDVKGAYHGVDRNVLLRRLRGRQVPEVVVRWEESFCSNRQACVVVNGETSDMVEIFSGCATAFPGWSMRISRVRVCEKSKKLASGLGDRFPTTFGRRGSGQQFGSVGNG